MKNECKGYYDKLYELRDEMVKSIDSVKNVIAQQKEMTRILKETTSEISFTDFVKQVEESTAHYESQIKLLQKRIDLLNLLIADLENDKSARLIDVHDMLDKTISTLLVILGIVKEDDKENQEQQGA